MTYDKYIRMCEEFGDKIDYDQIPPMYEDFPSFVHYGIQIFNMLPDNYTSTMEATIYVGKDYSSCQMLLDLYKVPDEDRLLVVNVVHFLDSRARRKAIDNAKRKAK